MMPDAKLRAVSPLPMGERMGAGMYIRDVDREQ